MLGLDNVAIRSGKTPAVVEGIEAGNYRVVVLQGERVGQRYAVTAGAGRAEVVADFGLQSEWHVVRREFVEQQAVLDIGQQVATQVGPKLLRELALLSLKPNEPIRGLLAKHGYMVQPPAGPPPGGPAETGPAAGAGKAPTTPPPQKAPAPAPAPPPLPAPPTDAATEDWTADAQEKWQKAIDQLRKSKTERERSVKQYQEIQTKFVNLVTDLIELAKTDGDAAVVVERFQIKRNDLPGNP